LSAAFKSRKASSAFAARRRGQLRVMVALLGLSDLFLFVLALRLAQWSAIALSTWHGWFGIPFSRSTPSLASALPLWLAIAFPTLAARGLYRFRYRDGIYSVARAVKSVGLAGLFFAVLIFFLRLPMPRVFVLLVVVYSAALLGVGRVIFLVMAAYLPPLNRRVLVVGSGPVAESTARMVAQYRRQGLYLVSPRMATLSQADIEAPSRVSPLDESSLERIATYIHSLDIDDVVITRDWYERYCSDVEHVFTMLNHLPAQVHVAPDPAELLTRMSVGDFSGFPVLSLSLLALPRWQMASKRAFDVVAAALLIALLSPLLLIIALGIILTSPGPAIFKQTRVGQYHRLFTIYKFRTMFVNDPATFASASANKRPGDPRITPFGRWLRRMSLDELPQLINVIKGDMSLVGPRPELPSIVAQYHPWQYGRLLVPQGLTGWWQVNGRGERLLSEHTEDDIYYMRNFSLLTDLRILLMTVGAIITGRGAF
jgi:exopolysaccharide biosynthesis polyprenyl glycosylphosphotransferase